MALLARGFPGAISARSSLRSHFFPSEWQNRVVNLVSQSAPVIPVGRRPSLLGQGIEGFFQVSLFLLIVTGFIAIAGTGKLDPVSLLFVSAALIFRGWQLATGRGFRISETATTRATVIYSAFYVADLFLISGSFVVATVHMVLFIMVAKIFSVQRDRDHVYLAIISFMMLLATAVLTVDTFFLAVFSVFILLCITTFISMEIRRSLRDASALALPSGATPREFAGSLSRTAIVMVAGVFVAGTLIFFALPRLSSGYLSSFAPKNDFTSGFSNDVVLGQIGQIQQSNAVVMHVHFLPGSPVPPELKLRGVMLTTFDGRAWTRQVNDEVVHSGKDGILALASEGASPGPKMRYDVKVEPVGANVFFLVPDPLQLTTHDTRAFEVDESRSVVPLDATQQVRSYSATSIEPDESAAPEAVNASNAGVSGVFFQLPPGLDPRIARLAEQTTAASSSPLAKARAIEQHLRTSYGYTLDLYTPPGRDPLAYFLFERKRGHCEYFASSMAIMLRTIGIPSRIVNGFRGGEYNDVTGSYIIRGRDAHSWVEAFIPGYGWQTFDPTPLATPVAPTGGTRLALYLDAAREFWREWIINYDFSHQNTLTATAVSRTRRSFIGTQHWIKRHYNALLARARTIQRSASALFPRTRLRSGLAAALLLLLLNLRRIIRWARVLQLTAQPEARPHAAATLWYERMTRLLGKRGIQRRPAQTQIEFARSIETGRLRESVVEFTRHYEHARFGASPKDAAELPQLYGRVRESLKK